MRASPRKVRDDADLKEYILDTISRLENLVSRLETYTEQSGEVVNASKEDPSDASE